jgi:hypothetical protein
MSPVDARDLSERWSHRLANHRLSDDVIQRVADRVLVEGLEIARFDPCIYGICVDYWTKEPPRFELDIKRGISKWEVFPYGIIEWDMFHVRITFEVNELEGKVTPRGFHN